MKPLALASRPQVSDSLHLISTSSVVLPTTRSKLLLHVPHMNGQLHRTVSSKWVPVCPSQQIELPSIYQDGTQYVSASHVSLLSGAPYALTSALAVQRSLLTQSALLDRSAQVQLLVPYTRAMCCPH